MGKPQSILMSAIIIATLGWGSSIASAASFSLNASPAHDQSQTLDSKRSATPTTKKMVVTGYGINDKQALKMAFRTAIEQYVGVVVDSSSIVKNSELIDDSLLTASSGYIQTYKILSSSNQDDLVAVKIMATVQSQKLMQSIHKLNIATIKVAGVKGLGVRIETKKIAKEDALKILHKAWHEAWNEQKLQDMLTVKIDSVKIMEEQAKEDGVPVNIQISLQVDDAKYNATIQKLETLFSQLGAKPHHRYDLPTIDTWGTLKTSNDERMRAIPSSSIVLLKHYGSGFVIDVWEFPKSWEVNPTFPYSLLATMFHLPVEFKDSANNILYAKYIEFNNREAASLFVAHFAGVSFFPGREYKRDKGVFGPFIFSVFKKYFPRKE